MARTLVRKKKTASASPIAFRGEANADCSRLTVFLTDRDGRVLTLHFEPKMLDGIARAMSAFASEVRKRLAALHPGSDAQN